MSEASMDYLYIKYGFDKDDYKVESIYSHVLYCVKDGRSFKIECVGGGSTNKDNLRDNYQAKPR